jgi:dipeptidyl aminopeptidase/acylaminoacyl peptidase
MQKFQRGLLLLLCAARLTGQECHEPIDIRQKIAEKKLSAHTFAVNGDGTWLAYVTTQRPSAPLKNQEYLPSGIPALEYGSRLSLSFLAGGSTVDICPPKVSCFAPSWSPNGKSVAFYSDEGGALGLWEYNVRTKERNRLVPANIKVSRMQGESPQWSPDGQSIFFATRGPESIKQITRNPLPDEKTFLQAENAGAIQRWDRASGKVTEVVSLKEGASLFRLAPNGQSLAYITAPQPAAEHGDRMRTALRQISLANKQITEPASDILTDIVGFDQGLFAWHPDKELIAFVRQGKMHLFSSSGVKTVGAEAPPLHEQPILFSKDGKNVIAVSDKGPVAIALEGNQSHIQYVLPPGASRIEILPASPNTAWQNAKFSLVVQATVDGRRQILGLAKDAAPEILLEQGNYDFSPRGAHERGVMFGVEDLNTPHEVFSFDSELRRDPFPKSHVLARPPSALRISVSQLHSPVKVTSGETKQVASLLFLPEGINPDEKPPVIVIGYPGAIFSTRGPEYAGGTVANFLPAEIALRQGYAVALVDLPIGPEGKAGEPLQELSEVLSPQVRTILQSGAVDPNRFAVMGMSHGGYFASGVPTTLPDDLRKKLKAAVAISGIYDLKKSYQQTPWEMVHGQGRMGAPPVKDPARYERNSPTANAAKMETPLIVVQGTDDGGFTQAEELVTTLTRLKKNAKLAAYPGEGHLPTNWTIEHHAAAIEETLDFLRKNLGKVACREHSHTTLGTGAGTPAGGHE